MTQARSLAEDFMLLVEDQSADPRPIYDRLRAAHPVYWTPLDFWYVTSYDLAKQVVRDAATFSSDPKRSSAAKIPAADNEVSRFHQDPDSPAFQMLRRLLLFLDPPDHTRLRRLVGRAFTSSVIQSRTPAIRAVIDSELDALRDRDEFDLLSDFGLQFPTKVILELVGIESDQAPMYLDTAQSVITLNDMSSTAAELEAAVARVEQTSAAIAGTISALDGAGGDNLLATMVSALDDGDRLTEEELVAMILLLVIAGHETTAYTLGSSIYHLLRDADQLEILRRQSAAIPTAVEELLRFEGAARHSVPRWATRDIDLGDGVRIREGDTVYASLQAADHDPSVFECPNQLDVLRDPNPHIAFGFGAHFCVGAPLARLELKLALEALLRRTSSFELGTDAIEWRHSFTIRGPKTLPLRAAWA
jgi:cytochrome P450